MVFKSSKEFEDFYYGLVQTDCDGFTEISSEVASQAVVGGIPQGDMPQPRTYGEIDPRLNWNSRLTAIMTRKSMAVIVDPVKVAEKVASILRSFLPSTKCEYCNQGLHFGHEEDHGVSDTHLTPI